MIGNRVFTDLFYILLSHNLLAMLLHMFQGSKPEASPQSDSVDFFFQQYYIAVIKND